MVNDAVVHADEAASWDHLHECFAIERINHPPAYRLDGARPDMAAEYIRLRRAAIGIPRQIADADRFQRTRKAHRRQDRQPLTIPA